MSSYVIEIVDGIVVQLISCEDSVEGTAFAHKTFTRLANDNGATITEDDLDEGFWRDNNGYSVQIVRA